jgi:prepilin-type N-terminal cleavage/methylation domain-containing protein
LSIDQNFRTKPPGKNTSGFSLIELAVAIVVIALLLGSLLVPLSTQVDQRRYAETQTQLEHVRDALIGFALVHRYLPCPAISATDGHESPRDASGICTTRVGIVPWAALGVAPQDAWDNLIRYSVTPKFTQSTLNNFFGLDDTGDIKIFTRDNTGAVIDISNDEIPAVILSHGKNGYGATSTSDIARAVPGSWTGDESENASNTDAFYFRTRSEVTTATGGEFDDVVSWISLNQLMARMVSAGRLP